MQDRPGWQLDASAPEAYDEYLVPAIFGPWADRLIDIAELREGDRFLDLACGTGIVARRAADRVGNRGAIVGLDINEGMLHVAKQYTSATHAPVEWRHGNATDLPFSEMSFDVVCSQQALQFFDDPVVAVGEMDRVLADEGCLVLSIWRSLEYQPAYLALAEALDRHIGHEAGEMMRSPFPAWDAEDLRSLVREGGFEDVSITIEIGSVRYPSVSEFIRREAASSPLADSLGDTGQAVQNDLVSDVEKSIGGYIDDAGVTFPMESHVVTA